MKKIIFTILIFCLSVNPAWATNTYTTDLDGTSQYWSSTNAGLGVTDDFSIEAWWYVEAWGTQDAIGKFDNAQNPGYRMMLLNGTVYCQYGNASTAGYCYTAASAVSIGEWTHIACTFDVSTRNNGKVYVNGSDVTSACGGGSPTSVTVSGDPFTTCYWSSNNCADYFQGWVDDVRVWSDIRTPTEILNNYNCSLDGDEANLLTYYRFDNNGNDSTSNGYNLTNNNSATFQSANLPFTNTCSGDVVVTANDDDFLPIR